MSLDFSTALSYLKMGRKIRRKAWDEGESLLLKDGEMRLEFSHGGSIFFGMLTQSTILAEDWELVD